MVGKGLQAELSMTLPGIPQLEATPEILRLLLAGVTPLQTQWKPSPERFSLAELLEHLSHVEGHYFRQAAEQMVSEDYPEISPYDQNAYFASGIYSDRDAEDSFDHWEEQREENIAYLNGLKLQAADRKARHPDLGDLTLHCILNEWAFHDLGHIRQVAELVRAIRYYPELGHFASQYQVHP